jgi:hypothetical protein
VIKRTKKESDQEANTKIDFFENLLLLKLKSEKLMKVRQQPGSCAQEIAD